MRFVSKWFVLAAILALATTSLFAQAGVTGTLTGTVTQDGTPLPGVTVTVTSPNLQGARNTVTNEAGGYNFGALPAGDYTVRFELAGLQTQTRREHVGVAQTARLDVNMTLSAVTEAITVTAAAPAVAETTEVQANISQELVEELPIGRGLVAITNLAPGVTTNGPNNAVMISGGQSFDNLFTVNGAVVQENLRGQPHNLFIEDAIQETTVQAAGISAEYGNFTGGVVNAITRSGGNEFSGSLRDSLTNPTWTEEGRTAYRLNTQGTPVESPRPNVIDRTNPVYEGTLGGRIIRDRLWFFTSGRFAETSTSPVLANGTSYSASTEDRRWEAKLTGSITPRHSLVLSYLEAPVTQINSCQGGCFDVSALDPSRELPNDFSTFMYNGVLTNNLLLEARWAEKNFAFVGSGGDDRNLATGTPILLSAPGFNSYTNESQFCGVCTDEERNSDQLALKVSYFLGTRAIGNHNIVVGGDRWMETRLANNYQSPTDYRLVSRTLAPKVGANGQTLISLMPGTNGSNDYVVWFPIVQQSEGSDLQSTGIYVNDKWDLNNRWSFNLGARMDTNVSQDAAGNEIADDRKVSPRVGAAFDTFGNGRLRFNATYGTYVGRLAETVAGSGTAAGTPLTYAFDYQGPEVRDVTPEQAAAAFFTWFNANGGTNRTAWFQSVPGFNQRIQGTLVSPNVREYTFGVSTQFSNGFLRADYVDRDWQDFYAVHVTRDTGIVTSPTGARADLRLVTNTRDLERTYRGVNLQGSYRAFNRLNLGANYTWSELRGNVTGETANSGPVTSGDRQFYPEYLNFAQNNPVGFLPQDQTHKLRAWGSLDFATPVGSFNVSVLERFDSGTPYSLAGTINIGQNANFYGTGQPGGVANPGYVSPQNAVTYFFSERGQYRFDDLTATDLALNYNTNPGWLRGASIFVQGEMLNVFNQDALVSHDVSILTQANDPTLRRFNPLAGDVPQEGVHYRRGPLFGLPTLTTNANTVGDYQLPRTYRVSFGVRF